MKAKQRMSSSADSARLSQLAGLGIATIFLINGAIPQQLLATEVSLDNLTETEYDPTPQRKNISYKAADLQLDSGVNSVDGSLQEQLLAREVDSILTVESG